MLQGQAQSKDHLSNLMSLGRSAQVLIYNICPSKGDQRVPATSPPPPGSVVTGGIIYGVGTELSLIWQTCKYFPGAGLNRGPRTGSPNFPARGSSGSLPLQRRLRPAASRSWESRRAARWLPAARPPRHALRGSESPARRPDPGKCEPALPDPQPLPRNELASPLSISCSLMLCILMYLPNRFQHS